VRLRYQLLHVAMSASLYSLTTSPIPPDSPTAGTSDSAQNSANLAGLELEDEEEWLTGLQTFISDVTSSGAVPQSTPSSGPSLSVVTDAAGGEVRVVEKISDPLPSLAFVLFLLVFYSVRNVNHDFLMSKLTDHDMNRCSIFTTAFVMLSMVNERPYLDSFYC
jgi:hypothetical protein